MFAHLIANVRIGLYEIVFYLEAFVHESISFLMPLPTCIARTIAILSHVYCAIHDAPPDPPFVCHAPYHFLTAISCKGQCEKSLPSRNYRTYRLYIAYRFNTNYVYHSRDSPREYSNVFAYLIANVRRG